ncbi:hypothetical protein A4S05_01920 [Nostoc sp. KVJ20]|nr:hypothetical protein A4S05_01920 [Nostoc sp. KVJ20]
MIARNAIAHHLNSDFSLIVWEGWEVKLLPHLPTLPTLLGFLTSEKSRLTALPAIMQYRPPGNRIPCLMVQVLWKRTRKTWVKALSAIMKYSTVFLLALFYHSFQL